MTFMETTADLDIQTRSDAELVVDPSDITFHDLTRDTVLIQVKIRNEGAARTGSRLLDWRGTGKPPCTI